MTYVYDIILNWSSEEYFDFFEWELNDDIEHIKRIPFFKVSTNLFNDFINYDFQISKEILDKIYNMTEIYTNNKIEVINYGALFSDGIRVLAIEFNEEGKTLFRSGLLLDEENDVLMLSNKVVETSITINKLEKKKLQPFMTRYEKEVSHLLKIEIQDCYNKGNIDKLKYLYYECFGKNQEDIKTIYQQLLESIDNRLSNKNNKLYEVIKLSYQNKG